MPRLDASLAFGQPPLPPPPPPSPAGGTARRRGIQVAIPIIVGNWAQPLSPGARECAKEHTHRWCVYVRGNEVGRFVRKVVFRLHDSFANPVRTVDHEPFEVRETGWGEFEVGVAIHLADALHIDGRHILRTTHNLRLHAPGDEGTDDDLHPSSGLPPVTHEIYDELVVNDPPAAFYELAVPALAANVYPLADPIFNAARAADELATLEAATTSVARQSAELLAQLQTKYSELVRLREACGLPPPSSALATAIGLPDTAPGSMLPPHQARGITLGMRSSRH